MAIMAAINSKISLEKILKKSVVLVTGAGGTIGSELCRQLSKFKPKLLILLDISEYQLYKIDTEFSDQFSELNRISLVGDVKSDKRIEEILKKYDLRLDSLDGMKFNLLKDEWKVSKDKSINYIGRFIKNQLFLSSNQGID